MTSHAVKRLMIAALLGFTFFTIWGMMLVPFHPDESSLLYQSRDLEALLSDPLSIAWNPNEVGDYEQTYRALNAPLGKYVIGLGRLLAGYDAGSVAKDWDWSESWENNVDAGAFPDVRLRWGSRLSVTLLLPFSLILIYYIGKRLADVPTGLIAAILFGTNSLILLHNRRAMSEGSLTFALCLALLGMLLADRRPWLAGLGSALAMCAKYSTTAIFPVALLASIWFPSDVKKRKSSMKSNLFQFLGVALAVVFLLHPFLWSDPIGAGVQIWQERQDLLKEQVDTLRTFFPDQVLDTGFKRIAALLWHLFFSPLQFAEVGNYSANTYSAVQSYLAIPCHTLFRGMLAGGILLSLTTFGILVGVRRILDRKAPSQRRLLTLFGVATLAQAIGLLLANPLPIQRYYLPLVPFVCLWIAYGIAQVLPHIKSAVG
jgi:4-amino-4-deoxy-L-arabinose transferase-like glycosyltransferase